MKDEATPEMIEMAQAICARVAEGDSDNPLRVRMANRYLAGELDDDHHMALALAAIIETQRLDANLADEMRTKHSNPTGDEYTCGQWDQGVRIAVQIRAGKHYGKDRQ